MIANVHCVAGAIDFLLAVLVELNPVEHVSVECVWQQRSGGAARTCALENVAGSQVLVLASQ